MNILGIEVLLQSKEDPSEETAIIFTQATQYSTPPGARYPFKAIYSGPTHQIPSLANKVTLKGPSPTPGIESGICVQFNPELPITKAGIRCQNAIGTPYTVSAQPLFGLNLE